MVDPIAEFLTNLTGVDGKDLTLRTPRARTHGLAAKSSPDQGMEQAVIRTYDKS